MATRSSSLIGGTSTGIDREIGSQYDNVKIVADNIDVVTTMATGIGNINVVAENIDSVIVAAGIDQEDLSTVASIEAEIKSLYNDKATLDSLYADKIVLDSIYTDKIKLDSLYADKVKLDSIFADKTTLDSLYADKVALDSLYNDKVILDSLYADKTTLDRIYASIAAVDRLAISADNIDMVEGSIDNVDTVAGSIASVNTVATDISNVNILAADINEINEVYANRVEIYAADENATIATTKAAEASASASAANISENNAATSESNAATSASNAAVSESNAGTSESNAAASESAAATSATNAAISESNVATMKTAVETIYDTFDDRFLGAKSVEPAVDNDGNALVSGALYFNTVSKQLNVYDDVVGWIALPQIYLSALLDVELTSISTGHILKWNGTKWINTTLNGTEISYNNTTSGLSATTIQAGIDELETNKADKATTLAGYGISDAYTKAETNALVSTGGGNVTITLGYEFTADGVTSTYDCGSTDSYIPGAVDVYLNGLQLTSGDYTATDGQTFVLNSLPNNGDLVKLIAYGGADVYNKTQTETLLNEKVDKVTSTDNAIVRFNGTSGVVQNSSVVIDDNGNVSGIGTAQIGGTIIEGNQIELGATSTGDRYAFIDFHTDDTNADYRARIVGEPSVNGNFGIHNRGNGSMYFSQGEQEVLRLYPDKSAVFKGDVRVGDGQVSSSILMSDSDNTYRIIHYNSGCVGFLNTSNGWALRTDNDGQTVITKKTGLGGDTLVVESNRSGDEGGQIKIRNNYYGRGTHLRVASSGAFEIVNNAYDNVNLAVSDDGNLYIRNEFLPLRGIMGNGLHKIWAGNLNDISWNSIYNIDPSTSVNYPIYSWGFVHTMVHLNGASHRTQVWWNMQGNSAYMRYTGDYGSNWSSWTQFA